MTRSPRFHCVLRDQLTDYVTAIAWSTDHCLFALSAAGELVQWRQTPQKWDRYNVNRETHTAPPSVPQPALNCLGISAGEQFMATGGQAGTLFIWKIQTGTPTIIQTHDLSPVWLDQLAWHPTRPRLAVGVGKKVYLWDIPDPDPVQILEFESSTVLGLAWHPNGQYLAVGGHRGVKVWDLNSQDIDTQTSPTFLEVPGASLSTAWSSDGQYLASGNLDRTLSVLDFGQPPPWLMQGFPSKVSHVAWGRTLTNSPLLAATSLDGIAMWNRTAHQNWQSTVLTGHQGLVRDIAFHPKGTLLASAGDEPFIRLWTPSQKIQQTKIQQTKIQQTLKGPSSGTHCIAWNPTGKGLAAGGTDGTILIFETEHDAKGFG